MKKRFLSVFLALALCLGLCAVPALAADEDKAAPVRVDDIGFSDVAVTDQYENYVDESGAPEKGCYNLGMIRLSDDAGEKDYDTYGVYIIPDDAEITFYLSAGHTVAKAYGLSLKEDELVEGVKAYTAAQVDYIEAAPMAETVSLTKDMVDARFGSQAYDLLACGVSNSPLIFVMFESKAAALGEPLPAGLTMEAVNWDSKTDMKFTLRSITEEFFDNNRLSAIYTKFTRNEETETVELKDVPVLNEKGLVNVRGIKEVSDGQKPWERVNLSAWSDPDGDGVYDQHLFSTYLDPDSITVVPLSNPGPFRFKEVYLYGGSGMPIYSRSINVRGADELTFRRYRYDTPEDTPESVTLSANFLTWLFGPDTLVQIQAVTTEKTEGPSFCCYIPKEAAGFPAFTDVPDWAQDAVDWAVKDGITNGTSYTRFSPDTPCNHAMILTFLWRAAGKPDSSEPLDIDFTGKNLLYAETALRWAAEKGMIDGTLNPNAPCTRAEAVTYIWQALGKEDAPAGGFTDVPANADYAAAVNWAFANGITDGTAPGIFSPDTVCTRGQIVTFLHRAYVPDVRLK